MMAGSASRVAMVLKMEKAIAMMMRAMIETVTRSRKNDP
jgi:hypothetical protein